MIRLLSVTAALTAFALAVRLPPTRATAPCVPPPGDPAAATCLLRVPLGPGRSACGTATVVGPRRPDGRWDVLTALHCFPEGARHGTVSLLDGRSYRVTLAASDAGSDVAWAVTDKRVTRMPWAWLSWWDAGAGTFVWHRGYGVDKPGNRETGVALGVERLGRGRMLKLRLNVSRGDSGSGLFDEANGHLLGVVSCTLQPGVRTSVWAAPASVAAACRPVPE